MFFISFPRSNSVMVPEVDEHERQMRCTDVLSESSYHMTSPWREIFCKKAEIMGAWTQTLEDIYDEDADSMYDDI